MLRSNWIRIAGALVCVLALPQDDSFLRAAEGGPDENLLREAGIPTDDSSLLAYLRKRTGNDRDLLQLPKLIAQLGSDVFAEREAAAEKLPAIKGGALSSLGDAAYSADVETARRAQTFISAIMEVNPLGRSGAVVRLLLQRRAPDAVEVLLRYLPYADDPAPAEDIWFGLYQLAKDSNRIPLPLRAALKDPVPTRRAFAACLVGRLGTGEERSLVFPLLSDTDPEVRLRAAQGLLAANQKSAVPALVSLLKDGSVGVAWQAEELLHWVARREGPNATLGAGAAAHREQCHAAWLAWWQEHGGRLDLERADPFPCRPILLLVCEQGAEHNDRVWLCGCDGKTRWELTHLHWPHDAQLSPAERILVADGVSHDQFKQGLAQKTEPLHRGLITERELDGKVRWEWRCVRPVRGFDRLPSGNTVVICDTKVMEVTPSGTEKGSSEYRVGDFPLQCFQWTRGDRVVCGQAWPFKPSLIAQYRRSGTEVSRMILDPFGRNLCAAQLLTTGNYLLLTSESIDRQLIELNERGCIQWHYRAPYVGNALRLREGTTLVGYGSQSRGTIVEVDPWGKIVWAARTPGRSPSLRQLFPLLRLGFDHPLPADWDIAKSVSYSIHGLRSADWFERFRSVLALEDLGPGAASAVPAVLGALDDSNEWVRHSAQDALASIGRAALPAILQALHDERPRVRAGAADVLGTCHREPKSFAANLAYQLNQERLPIRRRAAASLIKIDGMGPAQLPDLLPALGNKEQPRYLEIRRYPTDLTQAQAVAIILGNLGPAAQGAIPALTSALEAPDLATQLEVARALWRTGAEGRKALRQALESGHVRVNLDRVPLLAVVLRHVLRIIPEAEVPLPTLQETLEAIHELTQALKDSDAHVRARAATPLGMIGPRAKSAVGPLAQTLKENRRLADGNALDVARAAVMALGEMGPSANPAIPVLKEALGGYKDEGLRYLIRTALEKIDTGGKAPREELLRQTSPP